MKRRWLWLLIPLVGGATMFALSPTDEYAPLDRIGTVVREPDVPDDADLRAFEAEELASSHVRRRRTWAIQAPEAEARRTIDRIVDPGLSWWQNGTSQGSISDGKTTTRTKGQSYLSEDTQDTLEVERRTPTPPGVTLYVTVTESDLPTPAWTKIRRRLKRTFRR